MNKALRKVLIGLTAIVLSSLCIVCIVACSPIKSIAKTFNSLGENYTLEISESGIGGIKNYIRKYDGDKVYLNYNGEAEMVFYNKGIYTDVYTSVLGGSWSMETKNSDEISYGMTANYAFNAFELAQKDLGKYYYEDNEVYRLYSTYYALVFDGENKGLSCSIERIDGKTTIKAEFKEGRADKLAVIDVNRTKVTLPKI